MARQLQELEALAKKHGDALGPVPIVCAGDIFDKATPPVPLVNFALEHLPVLYAVPGQHDLLHHSYEDLRKTAFWTLMKAGRITLLDPHKDPYDVGRVRLHGFPWEHEITPLGRDLEHDFIQQVAVVHRYVWSKNTGYHNAPEEARAGRLARQLRGYQVAVFGDNHVPFAARVSSCLLWNCGGFYRRTSDQQHHRPSVGLLRQDGTVERHYLDVSQDRFLATEHLPDFQGPGRHLEAFLNEALSLTDVGLDVRQALEQAARVLPKRVRVLLLEAMEDVP